MKSISGVDPLRDTRVESEEVLYAADPIVTVDAAAIEALKRRAASNPRRRIRLCAHHGTADRVHEMLIVHTRDTYVRPHKHLDKCESFHVIEGEVDVVMFDEDGGIDRAIEMGSIQSGRRFFYRIADPIYHTLLIRSDVLVFHETTPGPFRREHTVFAPWAPADGDVEAVRRFVASVEARLRR